MVDAFSLQKRTGEEGRQGVKLMHSPACGESMVG